MLQFCFRVCVCTHTCLSHMECCILKIVYIGGRGILNSNYILWNKKGKEIRVHLCKWESILLETSSFLQDFFTEFLSSQQNTAEIVRYYFSRSLAFFYWKIHKGKYMPVSCNKLLGKKWMSVYELVCLSQPWGQGEVKHSHLHSLMLARATTHPGLVCTGQKTQFYRVLKCNLGSKCKCSLLCMSYYFHQLFHAFSPWCVTKWMQDFFGTL